MDYVLHIAVMALIWSSLALSQGVVTGYLGVLGVHQAAAWGIGAYAAALTERALGLPLWVAMPVAALVAGFAMLVVGRLTASGARDDQVVASLCVQILVTQALLNFTGLTNGPFGISGIGGAESQSARVNLALTSGAALLVCCVGVYWALARTGLPRSWRIARDDRQFAESLAIDVGSSRTIALLLAGAMAGAAGAVFAWYLTFIDPSSFGLAESVAILAITVIGRAPAVASVIAAAAVIISLPEALRSIGLESTTAANLRQALFGVFLVVAMLRGR